MNTRSISFRLVGWHAGWLAGIFVLLCAVLYLDLRYFLESDVRESMARRARQISSGLLAHIPQTGEPFAASQIKGWYEPEINARFIRVTRSDGAVVYASGIPVDGSFNPAEVPLPMDSLKPESARKVRLPNGKTLMVAVVNYKAQAAPDYRVEFGTLLEPVEATLSHLLFQLAMGLPLAILLVTIGGFVLVRRALTPVERITQAAERITQHNLSERLPVAQTGDQLERLSVSLNHMITRLEDAFQNSKRFVADASHELRTPLTILRGELEDLAKDARLDSALRERTASLLEEAIHLSKIVESLFTLSRLDAGEAQVDWSRFDLAELAKSTADQMSLLADDKKIEITCDADHPAPVEGDRVRLKQVIVNLLDNAIKYTPEGGAIRLSVRATGDQATLEVADTGIGISGEALPHIFERFYRVDQSHSGEYESTGLGLSIVKAICTAHGAKIDVESAPGKGSRFLVHLPLSKNTGTTSLRENEH
jgi:heavy metal sensor kinase